MSWFSWSKKKEPAFEAPIAPETPIFVIGDIHGCLHLLNDLMNRLEQVDCPDAHLVLVGDYVDRGDDSAGVLTRVHGLVQEAPEGVMVCLKGNHEDMLLSFLDDPERHGPRWVKFGGLQTLASYRLGLPSMPNSTEEWTDLRDALRDRMTDEIESWLRSLPLHHQTGNIFVSHAGADPKLPLTLQAEHALMWGDESFYEEMRTDASWVVHGHIIVDKAEAVRGRIPVDTGAYATGRLTAAVIAQDRLEYVSTR